MNISEKTCNQDTCSSNSSGIEVRLYKSINNSNSSSSNSSIKVELYRNIGGDNTNGSSSNSIDSGIEARLNGSKNNGGSNSSIKIRLHNIDNYSSDIEEVVELVHLFASCV